MISTTMPVIREKAGVSASAKLAAAWEGLIVGGLGTGCHLHGDLQN